MEKFDFHQNVNGKNGDQFDTLESVEIRRRTGEV